MKMHKLAIIQARMTSSRLPGKVMQEIAGRPMLSHVIERTKQAKLVDQIVVATTTDPSDELLEQFCARQGIACYRGSLTDVLDRFYNAASQFNGDVIIRLTADCPLLDPEVIDLTVLAFLDRPLPGNPAGVTQLTNAYIHGDYPFDFCANRLPPPWQRSLPIGLDVEVCSFGALKLAWKQADQVYQREHVLPFLYEGVRFPKNDQPDQAEWFVQNSMTPRGFRVALLNHFPDYGSLRWTVDTPADLDFIRQIYERRTKQSGYGWKEILTLLDREPELATINSTVKHKSAFDVDKRIPPS